MENFWLSLIFLYFFLFLCSPPPNHHLLPLLLTSSTFSFWDHFFSFCFYSLSFPLFLFPFIFICSSSSSFSSFSFVLLDSHFFSAVFLPLCFPPRRLVLPLCFEEPGNKQRRTSLKSHGAEWTGRRRLMQAEALGRGEREIGRGEGGQRSGPRRACYSCWVMLGQGE